MRRGFLFAYIQADSDANGHRNCAIAKATAGELWLLLHL